MAEIRIDSKESNDCMSEHFTCAFRFSKEEREVYGPEVGQDEVYMQGSDGSGTIMLLPVRLVAIQEEPDGGCICICRRYT